MIEISSAVGSAELAIHFKTLGVPHTLVGLNGLRYGDFAFLGNGPKGRLVRVAIERKTWPDFLASTSSNRFNGDQLVGLVEDYDDISLYLEGYSRCNPDTYMFEYRGSNGQWTTGYGKATSWHAVKGMLNSFEHCGVKLDYPPTPFDTALYVTAKYQWYNSKTWEEHNSHQRVKELKFDVARASKILRIARALGIGHIGAKKAEKEFGTVREMVSITANEWITRGIVSSKAQATRIWNMCN